MKEIRGIWFPDGDTHFVAQLAHNPLVDGRGTYQFRKYQAALPHVSERRHAVDIGAHVGLWSRVMAIDFAKVTAFEPFAEHVACFERNIAADHVKLHALALAEKSGELRLAPAGGNSGNAAIGDEGEAVKARTLDSFRLKDVDLVKIDVEGFEVPVILGGEKTLKRERPAIIVEQKPNGSAERYGRKTLDAVDLLKSWGAEVVFEIGGDFLLVWRDGGK
ncbi:FkbM family methyltransferase [Sinorhizobium americanum]|uniref:FkbM family methyltransferase n=1 Tax=Sinorhizobium americanum TaxID=194963 RepID=A0A4R2BRJ9_9HYPH|nr:FkbM family methyltransferase [Sinorhizobium americanum]TCN30338.1 FkbM family methyltransferase [Sinorhizobium americanum]